MPPFTAPVSMPIRLALTFRLGARGVAVHDHRAEIPLPGQERLADPQHVPPLLLLDRDARPDAGMDEQVAAGAVA